MELSTRRILDDDPLKRNRLILGVPVRGTAADLERLIRSQRIEELIISPHAVNGNVENESARSARRPAFACAVCTSKFGESLRFCRHRQLQQRIRARVDSWSPS